MRKALPLRDPRPVEERSETAGQARVNRSLYRRSIYRRGIEGSAMEVSLSTDDLEN
jgi:hypothetical protein